MKNKTSLEDLEVVVVVEETEKGDWDDKERWEPAERAVKDMLSRGIRPHVGDHIFPEGFNHKTNIPIETPYTILSVSYVFNPQQHDEPVLYIRTSVREYDGPEWSLLYDKET